MITRKSKREIEQMQKAADLLVLTHKEIAKMIRPGITTAEIDAFVEDFLRQHDAIPEQIGFNGYEYATCASVNDEICHGFPRDEKLNDGDIVTIDMVVNLHGGLADSAWTYAVGNVDDEGKRLMDVTLQSLYKGIEQAKAGNRIGDIGHAIQTYVEAEGFSVVRDFTGHGVGPTMHEDPLIPHFGKPGKGIRLKEGMAITIEPMVNEGTWQSKMDSNGWTARTVDKGRSAQYEHTLIITNGDPIVLTEQNR
ncbi:type I methionyl aminopeptidase [Virgibacillus sp. 179-BFC.A HS]|uniref:Methionine aminopeptidase n=1 Tax=Tigheibacillus jepli TaxID=3035914 RepID=A0ABU5CIY9_9BACI|nr:type I methionyl aminopeptidase [Virgibacillus sp. 179-BFC.A HS]MDY0406276.1 type I methionyl aminopeptidase [Virgibacillus sp. 179-BFC.A HS]